MGGPLGTNADDEYNPVLYKIVKDPVATNQREALGQIQSGFIERAERLLRQHQQRSQIHDGLKHLTNQEIINKVTESPVKLKRRAKALLISLRKNNVELNFNGEINYDAIKNEHVERVCRKQEALVKVTLMQADLEFEYPQKMEKLLVKSDLLKWLDEEEDKLRRNASEGAFILNQNTLPTELANQLDLSKERVLTVDDYYDIDDHVFGSRDRRKRAAAKIPFEEFVSKTASEQIFDNDLLEQQYKFWENDEERAHRLKMLWIELKRKNALGGIDAVSTEEQQSVNKEIADLLRRIRWRCDQELTRRDIEPVFKDNYTDKYDKDEFLTDAGFEFYKVKKLLQRNAHLLKDDPVLSIDYFKIITLIKQQKLLENTSDRFASED